MNRPNPLLVFALSLFFLLLLSGCGGGGGSGPSGQGSTTDSGAASASPDGAGGNGGRLTITGSDAIEIGQGGAVSPTPPSIPTPPTADPLTTITLAVDGVPLSDLIAEYPPYFSAGSGTVVCDRTLFIPAGGSLIFDIPGVSLTVNGSLVVAGSLESDNLAGGTLPINTQVSGSLWLSGLTDTSSSIDGAPGQPINLVTNGIGTGIHISGPISANGANSAAGPGGAGGAITLTTQGSGSVIISGAAFDTSGGTGTTNGGSAGPIQIAAGTITIGAFASFTLDGGGGVTQGGAGGYLSIMDLDPVTPTNCRITVSSEGGLATDVTSVGGPGGQFVVQTLGESRIEGPVTLNGGAGLQQGGTGGVATMILAAPCAFAALFDIGGGPATATTGPTIGGDGGFVSINSTGGAGTLRLWPAGFTIDLDGGPGGATGGQGGNVTITSSASSIICQGSISLNGGSAEATLGIGAPAGTLTLNASTALTSALAIEAAGGSGASAGGQGGVCTMTSAGTLTIEGSIDLPGGPSAAAPGIGGTSLFLGTLDVNSTCTIEATGGTGRGVAGANGGAAQFTSDANLNYSGSIVCDGGGGTPGGMGGFISLNATGTIDNTGTCTATGGPGDTGGQGGNILVTAIGSITCGGILRATGGNTTVSTGGLGGNIVVATTGASPITILGGITASGGEGSVGLTANGGTGGSVTVAAGYGSIAISGGVHADGGFSYFDTGGIAGSVTVNTNGTAHSAPGGSITNSGNISAAGGHGVNGGDGGPVIVDSDPDDFESLDNGPSTNTGTISASGGSGNNNDQRGGAPGTLLLRGSDQTEVPANLAGFNQSGSALCTYGDFTPVPANVTID